MEGTENQHTLLNAFVLPLSIGGLWNNASLLTFKPIKDKR